MSPDPIRIDAVHPPEGGRLGLTFCPGKTDPHGLSGPHARELGQDLRAIAQWGADYLVTLLEPHEFDWLGVAGLGEAAEMAGLDWSWLPIPDGGVPGTAFERYWGFAGLRLRAALRAGQGVVVHCRGGLGRAGLVATRLLVELGREPEAALAEVRRARRGAVETTTQEAYVRTLRPGSVADVSRDRLYGTLLGGALGDAFGYPVEFWVEEQVREELGPEGLTRPLFSAEGRLEVSDDTQMTLFTLAGLLEAGPPTDPEAALDAIRDAYRAWLDTQEGVPAALADGPVERLAADPRLQKRQAPGLTCLRALREGGDGTPEAPVNDSKGCGGVMRVAPVGLVAAWSPEESYEVGARSAALTHGHPAGYAAAGTMAATVRLLRDGRGLAQAAEATLPMLAGTLGSAEAREALRDALARGAAPDPDPFADVRALGEGWVAEEALAIGLYAALRGRDFPDVVRIAASHGGDSDSTAAIAGQLYGAWRGTDGLPHPWVRRLDVLEPLLDLAGRFPEEALEPHTPSTAREAP
ncbi:MAG: ADP-ribosylglycohydrolase family protein [Thiohalorhabdus sp.]|uniref:ADP-ribosylglycohydrolase family protein n=1 Tax=Thiohalorhabdus sp. TaxID=3094134 RepID=UPI0039818DBA